MKGEKVHVTGGRKISFHYPVQIYFFTLSSSVSDPDPHIFSPLDPDPQVKKDS